MSEFTLEISNLVNFTEAAEILGVSRPTIYALIEKQQLHPVAIGRNRYLLRDEIAYIKKKEATESERASVT